MPNKLHSFDAPKHGADLSFSSRVVRLPRHFPPLPPSLIDYDKLRHDTERAQRFHTRLGWLIVAGLCLVGFVAGWALAGWVGT